MSKKEEAIKNFESKYNCSQTVINVFCKDLGLDKDTALKLTKGFGGGASRGELCGAVSAGVMVLGLKYGDNAKLYIDKFEKRIEENYKSIRCEKMLGYNISNEDDRKVIESKNLKSEVCYKIVEDTVSILENMLENN